jgi:hypothetical protein
MSVAIYNNKIIFYKMYYNKKNWRIWDEFVTLSAITKEKKVGYKNFLKVNKIKEKNNLIVSKTYQGISEMYRGVSEMYRDVSEMSRDVSEMY